MCPSKSDTILKDEGMKNYILHPRPLFWKHSLPIVCYCNSGRSAAIQNIYSIRKQNIPEFVVCSTFAKQHDSVQKLLKGDSAVAIFVDNVEHLMDKNITIFHSKSAGKFFLGQSCSHNHNDIAGDFLKFPFFSYKIFLFIKIS